MKPTGMKHYSPKRRGFSFLSKGLKLRGGIEEPEQSNGKAVILIHGWGTCRLGPQRYFILFSEQLSKRGYTVFRFDLPGRGESEGNPQTVTLDGMTDSVVDCISYVKNNFPDVGVIGLCGICSGGNTAIITSLKHDVDFLILWSTFSFRTDKTLSVKTKRTGHFFGVYFRKLFSMSTWKKMISGTINARMIWKVLFGHYKRPQLNPKDSSIDVMGLWKQYKHRVLFVYGEKDPEAEKAKKFYTRYCSENSMKAEFVEIKDASHNFYQTKWRDELFSVSTEFLENAI